MNKTIKKVNKATHSDVYGEELWGLYKKQTDLEIVERDDGYINADGYGKIYFSDYKDWPPTDKMAMRYVQGRVLDVGCAGARHALYLQKKGYEVTGIDNSPLAIKISRLRGLKKAKVLPIEEIDVFKENSFDTMLMLGNNFGLFAGQKQAKRLLKKMYRITAPDGIIIAQTNDPYKTHDRDHLSYHALNRGRGRMGGQLRLRIRYGALKSSWFDYLMVSRTEMKMILADTQWKVKKFLTTKDAQYVAILEKKK